MRRTGRKATAEEAAEYAASAPELDTRCVCGTEIDYSGEFVTTWDSKLNLTVTCSTECKGSQS
jgi:hypothetical protein